MPLPYTTNSYITKEMAIIGRACSIMFHLFHRGGKVVPLSVGSHGVRFCDSGPPRLRRKGVGATSATTAQVPS